MKLRWGRRGSVEGAVEWLLSRFIVVGLWSVEGPVEWLLSCFVVVGVRSVVVGFSFG